MLFMASSKSGLTFNLARLAIALKKEGHSITVVSENKEEEKGLFEELGRNQIEHYEMAGLDNLSLKSTFFAARDLGRIIDQKKVRILHAQGIRHLLVAFFASKFFSRNRDLRILATIHSTSVGTRHENIILLIESFLLDIFADLAITVANYEAEKLINFGLFRSKVITIHNGVDLEIMNCYKDKHENPISIPPDFSKPSRIILGYFARLAALKGHRYLLEAFAQISKEHPDTRLLIAGEGPLRDELRKQSIELGIDGKVLFLGWIDHIRLFQVIDLIDIYVFPSVAELFPYTILEAMAAAKPIVSTAVGGIPEIIRDGENGILVSPRNSQFLVNGISRLIDNPKMAEKMGESCKNLVQSKFSLQKIAAELSHCYQSVAGEKS